MQKTVVAKKKVKRILLLSYAFPPMQAAETYLCAKALSKFGNDIEVDVITLDSENLGLPQDLSMIQYVDGKFSNIVRVKPPTWLNKKTFSWLRGFAAFPDRFRFFNSAIVSAAEDLELADYDLMISWSQWHSIHFAAAKIKNRYPKLPWVAHLSDPWADNPFLPKFPFYSLIQKHLEKSAISHADQLHFTTRETLNLVMKKYPVSLLKKAYVIPHSYDSSLYDFDQVELENKAKDVKVVRYLGNFYGPRNPETFLEALSLIFKFNPEIFMGIRFEFVGRWIGVDQSALTRFDFPEGLVFFKEPVSYLESLRLMRSSDMLLIIDAPFAESIFFPSKLVDYIGAERPILAFTPPGCSADILNKIGGMVFSPETVSAIQSGLMEAIKKLNQGRAMPPNKKLAEEYSIERVSDKYLQCFADLIPQGS